ncbi:MAG: hypothetical protein SFU25_11900 [Candidatus Caenarcaniphilales bacterium]|nr:hypothetical protein [Candidatus Caenarcaniphilales bacterium]
MHENKKPVELAQEVAKEVGGKVTGALHEAGEKFKSLNLKEKFSSLAGDLKTKGEHLKKATEELIEKQKSK